MKKILLLLICLVTCCCYAQERKVPFNGILKDFNDKPINKAKVYIKSPKSYSKTNKLGAFGLTNVDYSDTLKILIKKQLYKIPIENQRSIVILLDEKTGKFATREDQDLLNRRFDHVIHRERNIGMIISGERIRQTNSNNLLEALNGKVPGLNVSMNESGTVAKANIRGINSFNSDTTPLFVLDGFVVSSVNDIPLHDIDYVEVLKEGSFYGSRGANGAILIFTKTY